MQRPLFCWGGGAPAGVQHSGYDLVVSGTAAEIAGEPKAHLLLCWIWVLGKQRLRGDEESRRADAALQRGVIEERFLYRQQSILLSEPLY